MATAPVYIFGDTANAVLNTARSRVDDLILTPAGAPTGSDPGQQQTQVGGATLLTELNSDASLTLRTQVIFNSAYRKFQNDLANLGFRLLNGKTVISGLAATPSGTDISAESWISWNGFFDGASLHTGTALPSDLYAPISIRERVNGTGVQFLPMLTAINGLLNLPSRAPLNRQWEWRDNAIRLPGSTGSTDIQIQYAKFYPDLIVNLYMTGPWYLQPVPFPGCLSPLAWYVAYEVLVPRIGEAAAAPALQNGREEMNQMYNRQQARIDQRTKQISESLARPQAAGFPDGNGGVQPPS